MILIFKIAVLIALLQLLYRLEKPFLCAALYAGVSFLLGLIFSVGLMWSLIGAAIGFGLSSLYFWLLYRFNSGLLHWVILIVGLLIGLV